MSEHKRSKKHKEEEDQEEEVVSEPDEETLIAYQSAEEISTELLNHKLQEPLPLHFTYFDAKDAEPATDKDPTSLTIADHLDVIPMEEEVASETESLDSTKTDSESEGENSDHEKDTNELYTWPGMLDRIIYRFLQDFILVRCLMSKKTRKVYTVIRRADHKPFVIIVAHDHVARLRARDVPREVRLMYKLRNQPNLAQMLGWCNVDKRRYCFIMNYYENCDLITASHGNLYIISKMMKGMLEGLKNMHNCGVVHRDLAKDNVLYDPIKEEITIIDFDTAAPMREKYYRDLGRVKYDSFEKTATLEQGEKLWKAKRKAKEKGKEVKKERRVFYTYKSDVYSLGVIFWMLLLQEKHSPVPKDLKKWVKKVWEKKKHHKHPELDLLVKMLSYDPAMRISTEEALKHPFISNPPPMNPEYKHMKVYLCKMMELDVPEELASDEDTADLKKDKYASSESEEEDDEEESDEDEKKSVSD